MGSAAEKEKEADKLLKKANKETVPSLLDFRFSADWEQAAPLYERAAVIYKQIGSKEKALEAYERAAIAQEKIGSLWHAAKHYEMCGDICKSSSEWERLSIFYKRAADMYRTAGKGTSGADALARGAKALEDNDSETAIKMDLEALDIYEEEGKENMGMDVYRATISLMIRTKRYGEAAQALIRMALACDRLGAKSSQCKAFLGAMVIHLHNQDAALAWQTFQDALDVEVFSSSDEAFVADALFMAYRSGSEAEIKRVVKEKSVFKQLDNQVARVAMKLPSSNFSKMAEEIDQLMGGEGEDEEEDVM
ncbi:hypothetical protein CEUSTIGMA_g6447.t1 [Chlamydomonas eustigma]|uniref:Gamma-soluble NSF attachment protein n=1 Tax=Chlamydomonas eustigma TaxID=1157962 RepID=A0A250X7G2_9CHLO|nr:hypothetical protein CEUSTIGMA_g6447.t1 [Chlamydomonas eustigma]|eukprot:GAX79007.1 hypothetical protein CEUSTIGMA_g6447.t1 [Chlamydomonas eustigma]